MSWLLGKPECFDELRRLGFVPDVSWHEQTDEKQRACFELEKEFDRRVEECRLNCEDEGRAIFEKLHKEIESLKKKKIKNASR